MSARTTEARRLWGQALSARTQGDVSAALRYIQQAVEMAPRSGALHAELGYLLTDTGRRSDAIEVLERFLRTIGKSEAVVRALAIISKCDFQDCSADDVFELLIADWPENPVNWRSWVHSLEERGEFGRALSLVKSARKRHPQDPGLLRDLGRMLLHHDMIAEAVDDLRLASLWTESAEDRSLLWCQVYLSTGLIRLGLDRDAIATLQAPLQRYPKSVDALCNCGSAYRVIDLEAAERCYVKAQELQPGCASAWLGLGIVLAMTGDTVASSHQLARAARIENDSWTWALRAVVERENPERANDLLAHARAIAPLLGSVEWLSREWTRLHASSADAAADSYSETSAYDTWVLVRSMWDMGLQDASSALMREVLRRRPGHEYRDWFISRLGQSK